MLKSTNTLNTLLATLTRVARQLGCSDAEWARRAGLPKETLCRLRSRASCDLSTLMALGESIGCALTVREPGHQTSTDGRWPAVVDRLVEARLIDVLGTGSTELADWRPLGPPFFLAGLAVTLASVGELDRHRYLDLAEALHPGATEPRVYGAWLAASPLTPDRFLPMLQTRLNHAA